MSNLDRIVNLLASPRSAFASLDNETRFWFPLLLNAMITIGAVAAYFAVVDLSWLANHLNTVNVPNLPDAPPPMAGSSIAAFSLASISTTALLGKPIAALFYLLVGRLMNLSWRFGQWLTLWCWAMLPGALAYVAALVALFLSPARQLTLQEANVLSFNELLVHAEPGDSGYSLLTSLTILDPWLWMLAIVGLRVWSQRSWLFCTLFILFPWLVIYGVWLLVSV